MVTLSFSAHSTGSLAFVTSTARDRRGRRGPPAQHDGARTPRDPPHGEGLGVGDRRIVLRPPLALPHKGEGNSACSG